MLQDNRPPVLQIVIPMAGAGSRFANAGYKDPKPLIPVRGRPMIQMVVENLRLPESIPARFIFVAQRSHAAEHDLQRRLRALVPGCHVALVDGLTEGACCTVLEGAGEEIDNDDPLMIANSDQFLEWDPEEFVGLLGVWGEAGGGQCDGVISTFAVPEPDLKWSYAKVDDHGFVTDVQEKNPMSDLATTGVYLWRRGRDFVRCARRMIERGARVNGEFYVAPVYNEGVADGLRFRTHGCARMWGTGVPADLDHFLKHCEADRPTRRPRPAGTPTTAPPRGETEAGALRPEDS